LGQPSRLWSRTRVRTYGTPSEVGQRDAGRRNETISQNGPRRKRSRAPYRNDIIVGSLCSLCCKSGRRVSHAKYRCPLGQVFCGGAEDRCWRLVGQTLFSAHGEMRSASWLQPFTEMNESLGQMAQKWPNKISEGGSHGRGNTNRTKDVYEGKAYSRSLGGNLRRALRGEMQHVDRTAASLPVTRSNEFSAPWHRTTPYPKRPCPISVHLDREIRPLRFVRPLWPFAPMNSSSR